MPKKKCDSAKSKLKIEIVFGTIRIKSSNLKPYKKTNTGWSSIKKDFPELIQVVNLFKSNNQFDILIDKKNPNFLKGQISPGGDVQGARINILPGGEKLEKAFSLFSPHLKIHDQDSEDHWDVIYQNKGGTWSYVYTLDKKLKHKARKYKKVEEFDKNYFKLISNVENALLDKTDNMVVPMFTLLNTFMRVGNEIYFKANGHRGLTTITKNNVSIDGNTVKFKYLGKDGVPINITHSFSKQYVNRLKSILKKKNKDEFIFLINGHTLHEADFKKAFKKYCGKEFYPHIVRSHYATVKVKKFLEGRKKANKEEVNELYLSIAHHLGHKKFNKKKQVWEEHYAVTVNSYVQPELVNQVKLITQ
ncbi:hypothetical protein HN385_05295 [archaeon]|jgi:hypothetical protein|nr:hypothetical protein [archaeon]MBT3451509.1 hypothetical protein [archaeon]MBT6869502.1 hypothetical protein [archaeon]MBT7193190.1 hypothetical protein [archaeon]MBT7380496.1 hypothetical protein [archaeon]